MTSSPVTSEVSPLDGLLEPGAKAFDVQVSIAISLKRIADALSADRLGDLAPQLDNIAWTVGQTLGRGFEIGSRRS